MSRISPLESGMCQETVKLVFPDTFLKDKDNIASVLLDLPDCLSGPHSIMECVSLITGADVVTQAVVFISFMCLHQIMTLYLSFLISAEADRIILSFERYMPDDQYSLLRKRINNISQCKYPQNKQCHHHQYQVYATLNNMIVFETTVIIQQQS